MRDTVGHLGRFSLGVGDRFAREAEPQLAAFEEMERLGVEVTPVWNKSNREHTIVGSEPRAPRRGRCGRGGARVETALLRGCRPHHRRTVDRFLTPATSSRSTWPTRSAGRRPATR